MEQLRNIAVQVIEIQQGGFSWILSEQVDGVWIELEVCTESFPLWLEAFDAGCVALFKLVPDERKGPRRHA